MIRLKTVQLIRERVEGWDEYPFSIPAIASFKTLAITRQVCFFVGENERQVNTPGGNRRSLWLRGEGGTETSRLNPRTV